MSLMFKTSDGREWNLKITLAIVARLKSANVIDLLKIMDDEMRLFKGLMADPISMCNVVYEIIRPQAEAASFTPEAFLFALDGDTTDDMVNAFTFALADLYPALRAIVLKGMEKGEELRRMTLERAVKKVDNMDLDKLIDPQMARIDRSIERFQS